MTEAPEEIGREELATLIEKEGGDFYALFDGEVDLEARRAIGEWSFRDLLAHLVAWHEECLWAIRSTIEDSYERRDYSDVNGWNAAAVSRMEGLGGKDLLARSRETLKGVATSVRQIPEDLWQAKRRLKQWPWNTTIRHFEEHEADVRKAIGDRQ